MTERRSRVPLFLAEADVDELTGIRRGRTDRIASRSVKYTKFALQIQQLRKMHIPFYVNAIGRPMIARATLEGHADGTPLVEREKWTPRVLHKAA